MPTPQQAECAQGALGVGRGVCQLGSLRAVRMEPYLVISPCIMDLNMGAVLNPQGDLEVNVGDLGLDVGYFRYGPQSMTSYDRSDINVKATTLSRKR